MPFDFLLHSLAQQYGTRAGCVVLTGTGMDGTDGLRSIKAHGGIVAVQDPAEAGYDGMPRSAIQTGMADFVLPLAAIPGALSAYRTAAADPVDSEADAGRPSELDAGAVSGILELLRVETGHDFGPYKSGTLTRRVSRRMALAKLGRYDIAGYGAMLRADRVELDALAGDC